MADQTTATWHVAEDGDGDLTLWHGTLAVLRPTDLRVTTSYQRYLFDVLTAVLAPDEATIDELAKVLYDCEPEPSVEWDELDEIAHRLRTDIRAVLAALADTPQARQVAVDATGGGEDG